MKIYNQKFLIIFILGLVGGIFAVSMILLDSQGIIPNSSVSNDEQERNDIINQSTEMTNMVTEIPLELKNDVEKMRGLNLAVSRWNIDLENKKFIVYTYTRTDPATAQIIGGKKAGNWTVELVYDEKFVDQMNRAIEESNQIRKIPEMKISAVQWSIDGYQNPPVYEAIVYVSEYSTENQKLNGTELQGWKMLVYRAASYPPKSA